MSNADCGESANPARNQAPGGGVKRAVKLFVSPGRETFLEGESGCGGGLGQDLWILEVKPAAERQPCGGEREARPDSHLRRPYGCAKGCPGVGREGLGPDQRQPQFSRARGGGRTKAHTPGVTVQRARHGHPFHFPKQPLDSLRGEVGEGTGEIKEKRRTRLRTRPGAVGQLLGEDD